MGIISIVRIAVIEQEQLRMVLVCPVAQIAASVLLITYYAIYVILDMELHQYILVWYVLIPFAFNVMAITQPAKNVDSTLALIQAHAAHVLFIVKAVLPTILPIVLPVVMVCL